MEVSPYNFKQDSVIQLKGAGDIKDLIYFNPKDSDEPDVALSVFGV